MAQSCSEVQNADIAHWNGSMVTLCHPPSLYHDDLFKGLRSERLEPRSVLIESVLGAWLEHVMWCYKLHKKSICRVMVLKAKMAKLSRLVRPEVLQLRSHCQANSACWLLWFDCLVWDYKLELWLSLRKFCVGQKSRIKLTFNTVNTYMLENCVLSSDSTRVIILST